MRQGDLFRIRHILVAIVFVLFAHPAHALWLDVSGTSYPVVAPLVISSDLPKPPQGDTRHGFFATAHPVHAGTPPRLNLQYRAEFPLSVTFEADGAVTVDEVAAGGVNLTTRIIFVERWWAPRVNANLGEVNLQGVAHGRIEAGQTGVRSEWKLKF